MVRAVTWRGAPQRLRELLESAIQGDEIAIERAGRRVGVLISPRRYADLQRIQDEARGRFWTKVDVTWTRNAGRDPDEHEAFAFEEVHAYRRQPLRSRTADEEPTEVTQRRVYGGPLGADPFGVRARA